MLDSHVHSTWIGLAFERLCLLHADQIKEALRIGGIHANIYSWHNAHAQIDLLIDRNSGQFSEWNGRLARSGAKYKNIKLSA